MTDDLDLLAFLNRLRQGGIAYRLSQHRDDAITVEVAVPGERWEVEFLQDGTVDVEIFRTDGEIHDAGVLGPLLAKHSDAAGNGAPLSEAGIASAAGRAILSNG